MSIRKCTLWRVPAICVLGSLASYYVTVYFGGHFFTASSVAPDGSIILSADPVRSAIWNTALFLAVVLGGIRFLRGMTRKEIAVSAGLITALYLAVVLAQLYFPGLPQFWGFTLSPFQNWTGTFASLFQKLTGNFTFSVIAGNFAPLLFIPFGRKERSQ